MAENARRGGLWARLAVIAGCVFAIGCGSSGMKSPATGGDAWYEARSPHFIIQTDTGAEAATELVGEYERLVAFFETVAFKANRQPDLYRCIAKCCVEISFNR